MFEKGSTRWAPLVTAIAVAGWLGCGSVHTDVATVTHRWSVVARSEAAAFLSVHGTAASDVWISGADDGSRSVVLHWDGSSWARLDPGSRADLWWVHATREGPVFFGGSESTLLRYEHGTFERLSTPGLGQHTVFGVWAAATNDVYAVGSAAGRSGFVWHYDGDHVVDLPLPTGLPEDAGREGPGFFKVWGLSPDDVWVVGSNEVVLRGNARDGFGIVRAGGPSTLFTVYGRGDEVVAVGGAGSGVLLDGVGGELRDRTPPSAPLLQGVTLDESGTLWAVGLGGRIYSGDREGIRPVETGISLTPAESLHAVWVDPSGGVWTVGGDVLTTKLDRGIALHNGADTPEIDLAKPPPDEAVCPESAVDPKPDASIARRWDEQIMNAIRRDVPRPAVHARNLFHFSIALWDAWSAFDDIAAGYVVRERLHADDADAARREAISYAAYRVLSRRYAGATGGAVSQACFDALMKKLGYDGGDTNEVGATPRALGNRIGSAIVARFANDGANENDNYADPDHFAPESPNLVVARAGTSAKDPSVWQRLVLDKAETENGIPLGAGAQVFADAHWGNVATFSLERAAPQGTYFDVGTPPASLAESALEILARSSELDPEDPTMIDIAPSAIGNNSLGANDGKGHPVNPATGEPYPPARVLRSDFGRTVAELWANGPTSETPAGHWNLIANDVAERPELERRPFGQGAPLDALAWDVRVYLALNAALHDAAIAAWEQKRKYVSARPITMIRYLAGRGQRSDPNRPSYDPAGMPLVDGRIELISAESSAPGERHAHLARFIGELAVRSWRGEPGDRMNEVSGVGWIRAALWVPYQRRTFVTPAFPGFVSSHSAMSRAAAVVLAGITGSAFFPGGSATTTREPGMLVNERGPSAPVRLEWATYADAADQAGQSGVWAGTDTPDDDFAGRTLGERVGGSALELVRRHFDGSIAAGN